MTDHTAQAASAAVRAKSTLERALDQALPPTTSGPPLLIEAMRYALLAPAKRARGVLACLAAYQFGADVRQAHAVAVAIEMVHAASLILDDLPCMDDAHERRGRACVHRVYGEDTAVLAAVGLMNQATLFLATASELAPACRCRLITALTSAIGTEGLVGGQEQDLHQTGDEATADVETMHRRKTGVLFALAASAGAECAGATLASVESMYAFGARLGLAFQTYDDLLDQRANRDIAGKDVGKDTGKVTLVALLGAAGAKAHADRQIAEALLYLDRAGGDTDEIRRYVLDLVAKLAGRAGVA